MATTMRRRSRALRRWASSTPAFAAAPRSRAPRPARDPDGAPLYPELCRALSAAEARARLARGDRAAWRLDMRRATGRAGRSVAWTGIWRGRRRRAACGRRRRPGATSSCSGRDLAASYHLAVVGRRRACRASPTSCAAGTSLAATAVHRLLQDAARPARRRATATTASCSTRRRQTVEEPSIPRRWPTCGDWA